MLQKYNHLFEPIKIGSLTIKNRFVMPPMLSEMDQGDHKFSDRAISYYAERAKGGFGLLITEFMCISPDGLGCQEEMGIWSDDFLPALEKLTKAVHKEDGKILAQLHHQGVLAVQRDIKQKAMGPSSIPLKTNLEEIKELSSNEVYTMITKFEEAAQRAQRAGFDGVEIHAAHSYLVGQFLSPYFNKRADEFGGSYENRFRFCENIIKGIKNVCGRDFPVSIRISASEFVDNAMKPHDLYIYCKLAEDAGADCIHISTGGIGGNVVTPYYMKPGFNIDKIEQVKKIVDIPVIGVGRMNDPAMMDTFIASGRLDLISLGRQSVCDPYLPRKLEEGRADEIIPCIGCLQRCFFTPGYDEEDTGISCMLNPFSGKERIWKMEDALVKKRVAVIGAGPAGMEAAWILAKRGQQVEVYEKEKVPGGAFRLAAVSPQKQDFGKVIHTYMALCRRYGAKIHFEKEVDYEFLDNGDWDVVIIATGAKALIPPIPGLNVEKQVMAYDVLKGKKMFADKKTLILGGGLVGCETAEFLKLYDNDITIVEMKNCIAQECAPIPRKFLLNSMERNHIKTYTSTKIVEVTESGVKVQKDNEFMILEGYEKIVIALGAVADRELSDKLINSDREVYVIGDAKQARDARYAIYEAALIGATI